MMNENEEYKITSFVYPLGLNGEEIEYGKIGFKNNIVNERIIFKRGEIIKEKTYDIKNKFREYLTKGGIDVSYKSIIKRIKECS